MSGGAATTTQTSGLDSSFAPYVQQFGSLIQNAANRPYQNYMGPRVADLSPTQTSALGGYQNVLGNLGTTLAPGVGMLNSTLSGNGGNPFTSQVVDAMQRPVIDAYNRAIAGTRSNFNDAGGIGSARQGIAQDMNDRNLATGLSDVTSQLYNNAYEQERNRQMQAAGEIPGLLSGIGGFLGGALNAGGVQQQQLQNVYNTNYGDFQNAYNYPWTQIQNISSALGPLFGGATRTQTTTGPGANPIQNGLGLAILGNMLFSGSGG